MSLKTVACGLAVAAMGMFASSALAGAWSAPAGDAGDFTYSNGQDINGHFGDPLVPGDNTFYYIAADFQVSSAGGVPGPQGDHQFDTTSFDAVAKPGLQFSLIRVTAFGTYAVTGSGASVDVDAGLDITENGGMGRNWAGPLTTTPSLPVTSGSGGWSGLSAVDITFEFPIPYSSLHVALSNDVLAISAPGSSATLNVQYQDLKIELIVPEPGILALLTLGGLAVLRRK